LGKAKKKKISAIRGSKSTPRRRKKIGDRGEEGQTISGGAKKAVGRRRHNLHTIQPQACQEIKR